MLQSCGRKSFNNTENPSDPPSPSRISPPTLPNTKSWIRQSTKKGIGTRLRIIDQYLSHVSAAN